MEISGPASDILYRKMKKLPRIICCHYLWWRLFRLIHNHPKLSEWWGWQWDFDRQTCDWTVTHFRTWTGSVGVGSFCCVFQWDLGLLTRLWFRRSFLVVCVWCWDSLGLWLLWGGWDDDSETLPFQTLCNTCVLTGLRDRFQKSSPRPHLAHSFGHLAAAPPNPSQQLLYHLSFQNASNFMEAPGRLVLQHQRERQGILKSNIVPGKFP